MIISTTFDSNRYESVKQATARFTYYRGWDYAHFPDNPITGRWCATRFGVGMSAGTEEQLKRMIDQRVQPACDQAEEESEAANYAQPDFRVENHGTICLFHPLSETAKEWLSRTAPEDAQFLGNAMAVEPRYAGGVIEAAEAEGLVFG